MFSLPWGKQSIRNACGGGNLHQEFGVVQHRFHRGPGGFVGGEKLGVLLVVGRQILAPGQMRQYRQDIVERSPGGFQNHLDAQQVLATLIGIALEISELRKRTGRERPTVIT